MKLTELAETVINVEAQEEDEESENEDDEEEEELASGKKGSKSMAPASK